MGNVREWVNKSHPKEYRINSYARIKGLSWLHGEEGFIFSLSTEVLAQNTNIDVGFRLARSLTREEMKNFERALTEHTSTRKYSLTKNNK